METPNASLRLVRQNRNANGRVESDGSGPITPPNLIGTDLASADFLSLEARWIDRPLAEAAFLRWVDTLAGSQLVGRRSGDYAGVAIPYFAPGASHVREYRLRRDHPDYEAGPNGELKLKQKYVSPPGRGNMLFLPPTLDLAALKDPELPIILTEGEFKTLAPSRLAIGIQSISHAFFQLALPVFSIGAVSLPKPLDPMASASASEGPSPISIGSPGTAAKSSSRSMRTPIPRIRFASPVTN